MANRLPLSPERFVPCTREVEIAPGIVYRPIRSWHSNVYAGERLTRVGDDASGCMRTDASGMRVCPIPLSYTHRVYWDLRHPDYSISAFLSYPNGMGCSNNEYFWEANGTRKGDIERFFGATAEKAMERKIVRALRARHKKGKETDGNG